MLKNLPILLALSSVGVILLVMSQTVALSVTLGWIVLLLGVALEFYSAVCLVVYNANLKKHLSRK
ncbi:Uncharacterised protein [Bacillus tequilensis]|nr:hypothetical protein [Bacillus tequilensis]SPU01743.1 Uncharacterised protein [Bacillus tequilensis]